MPSPLSGFVFQFSSKTAADMSFLFIYLKNVLDLFVELSVLTPETFADIFMYCALADAEVLCCCTDSRPVFSYVAPEYHAALIWPDLQKTTPREIISLIYMPERY